MSMLYELIAHFLTCLSAHFLTGRSLSGKHKTFEFNKPHVACDILDIASAEYSTEGATGRKCIDIRRNTRYD